MDEKGKKTLEREQNRESCPPSEGKKPAMQKSADDLPKCTRIPITECLRKRMYCAHLCEEHQHHQPTESTDEPTCSRNPKADGTHAGMNCKHICKKHREMLNRRNNKQ